jgi:multidrug resistance efflux pump
MKFSFFRITVALILLAIAVVALSPYATSYVSTSAVVNAPLIKVNAPFNGEIVTPTKSVGMAIQNGEQLFVLQNARSQKLDLQTKQTELNALSGEIVGMETQMKDLNALRTTLLNRREAQLEARTEWFIPRLEQAQANIERAQASLDEAKDSFDRNATLSKRGAVTQSTTNAIETEYKRATANLEEQKALYSMLEVERDTLNAENAVDLTSNGFEQIQYRLDEITVRTADISARLLERQSQRAGIKTQISSLALEAIRQENFNPTSSANGIIWEASQKSGTPVSSGERITKILDCSRRFLEVEISERHFEKVPPGTIAYVQMSGSNTVETLKVLASYGSQARPNRDMQAASERLETKNGIKIIVGLNPVDVTDADIGLTFCDVGRTADVKFDLPEDSYFGIIRRTFDNLLKSDGDIADTMSTPDDPF